MINEKPLSENRYAKLLADIRRLLAEGKDRAQRAATQELVRTYWTIGQRLTEEELAEQAGYGEAVMERLADELNTDVRTLQRTIAFYRAYKEPPKTSLSWSHYRELLVLPDKDRIHYEAEAEKEGWTRDQLIRAIELGEQQAAQPDGGKGKAAKKLARPTESTYVYGAEVRRVIDGDTLLLRLDLGFDVWKEQRLRLAGVNAPELNTKDGQETYSYVQEQMTKAKVLVCKTHMLDKYGRFVGHIFYSFDESADRADVFKTGRYLNQELLDKDLVNLL
jgi:endonuclease YncB( thermonuclease family)